MSRLRHSAAGLTHLRYVTPKRERRAAASVRVLFVWSHEAPRSGLCRSSASWPRRGSRWRARRPLFRAWANLTPHLRRCIGSTACGANPSIPQLQGVAIAVGASTGSCAHTRPMDVLGRQCRKGSVSLEEEENFGGSFEEQVLVSYALDHHVPEEMSLVPEVYAGAVGCLSLALCDSPAASEVGTHAGWDNKRMSKPLWTATQSVPEWQMQCFRRGMSGLLQVQPTTGLRESIRAQAVEAPNARILRCETMPRNYA